MRLAIKTIIFLLALICLGAPNLSGQGWDWGVKAPDEPELFKQELGSDEVPISTFTAIEVPAFGIFVPKGKESLPDVLADLTPAQKDKLQKLLIEAVSLNYKLGEAFRSPTWEGFVLGDLFKTKSLTFKHKVEIRQSMKKLLRIYSDLVTNYGDFFDTFSAYVDGTPLGVDGLKINLWGEGKLLERQELVVSEVLRSARMGNPSSIMKWMVYYTEFIIPKLENLARKRPKSMVRSIDPLWELKQGTFADTLETWGNFWSDIYSDPRMYDEPPQVTQK